MGQFDRQSQLIGRTRREAPAGEPSRNAQLLMRAGYVDKLMAGAFSMLPLGYRVLARIEEVIREEMREVGGQEVLMPALHPVESWETTGRADMDVLYRLSHGDRRYVLGPTHEEVVTPLLAANVTSYRDLPAAVFQIQNKFRAEARPKSGLLRGREFGMKDMYSFHTTSEDLDEFYEQARGAYTRVFQRCGLGEVTHYTYASGGAFSKYSHEFQAVTEYGEDTIYCDPDTGTAINKEIIDDQSTEVVERLQPRRAIEIGNIFKLMRRFSDAIGMTVAGPDGTPLPIYMGCYGIGTTRLLGAVAEILADDRGLVWPVEIAPYRVHVVALPGEEPEATAGDIAAHLASLGHSVLLDDRDISPGKKLADAELIGIPTRVVVSKRTLAGHEAEVTERATGAVTFVKVPVLPDYLTKSAA